MSQRTFIIQLSKVSRYIEGHSPDEYLSSATDMNCSFEIIGKCVGIYNLFFFLFLFLFFIVVCSPRSMSTEQAHGYK